MDASLHLIAHDRRMVELERDLARHRDHLPYRVDAERDRARRPAPDRAERRRPRLVSQARTLLRLA